MTSAAATECSAPSAAGYQSVYKKIVWRLMPFILLAYVVNQIDRTNIGFAKLKFMSDIGLSDASYGLGAGLFFIGYVLFEVPSNLYLQRIGVRATLLRIMILWGSISMAMAFIQTPSQFYLARFLLGAAEAGFTPRVLLFLTYWFPAAYRGRITSFYLMAITFSGILGGPISGWILHSFGGIGNLKPWQWLFLIEGAPAVILGVIAYLYLDDKPEHAKWLTDAEKGMVYFALLSDTHCRAG